MPELIAPLEQLVQAGVVVLPDMRRNSRVDQRHLKVGFGEIVLSDENGVHIEEEEYAIGRAYHVGVNRGGLHVSYDPSRKQSNDSPTVSEMLNLHDMACTRIKLSNGDKYEIHTDGHFPDSEDDEISHQAVPMRDYLTRVSELNPKDNFVSRIETLNP